MKRLFPIVLCLMAVGNAGGQSLRGSRASVDRMYTRAVRNDLDFYKTSKGIYQSVRDGELAMLNITMDVMLDDVAYPFVLPRTLDVLTVFAKKYHDACGERVVITSAARPRTEQPRNASPKSVHPTGMAIDFRKPAGTCLAYMRNELVLLERQGVVEVTEEKHPVHFHVAVLQRGLFAPAAPAIATATPSPHLPTMPSISAAGAPITLDSASGAVDVVAVKTYAVRKGDTLSGIAKRFGLTVTRLKSLNGLKGSSIRPGQTLRVS